MHLLLLCNEWAQTHRLKTCLLLLCFLSLVVNKNVINYLRVPTCQEPRAHLNWGLYSGFQLTRLWSRCPPACITVSPLWMNPLLSSYELLAELFLCGRRSQLLTFCCYGLGASRSFLKRGPLRGYLLLAGQQGTLSLQSAPMESYITKQSWQRIPSP